MKAEIVVVGTSLGGLAALEILLSGLPREFPLPIAIVQHRGVESDDTLILLLQVHSALPVLEPDDKDPIEGGRVYIAPAGYHLLVDRGSFALSTDGKVCYARPSIDVLFDSAAESYKSGVIGVVLTGASRDGSEGLARIKERGGFAVVQDPKGAEAPTMPEAAIARVKVDRILPLPEIAPLLNLMSHMSA
ncbi:MAG: chemotaxis protein CheB [Polyangiaceae bacterium]|nr:chemotaxis protein CheB [Polyangiaceae bacterium]NUQ76624.1 chemotaxis protein CheB [Polyangiaceae bacterium]